MQSEGGRAATRLQREWRGFRQRFRVEHIPGWKGKHPDRADASDTNQLTEFLEAIALEPAFGFERRASQELTRALMTPNVGRPWVVRPKLQFPLTRSGMMEMLSAFCRGQLIDTASASEVLRQETVLLQQLPNIVPVSIPEGTRLIVVGDLHGQFLDLMHIFRRLGFPSETNWYLFNGDFVDRGDCGVEVTLTIFGWQQVYPYGIFLNRGNHEERSVHSMHGFQQECTAKYDKDVYELFNDAFAQLPIATRVNKKVLILHGGIDDDVDLDALAAVPRDEYVVNASNSTQSGAGGRQGFVHPHMRSKMEEIRKRDLQMHPVNAALWNDPMKHEGWAHNKMRGTGRLFGPDVTGRFLDRFGLELIIRSHEQVMEGYEWPFENGKMLVTIFSASNYAGRSTNSGAVAIIGGVDPPVRINPQVGGTGTTITTNVFGFGKLHVLNYDAESITTLRADHRNLYKLACLFVARRTDLKATYHAAGSSLTPAAWVSVTHSVLGASEELLFQMLASLLPDPPPHAVDAVAILDRFHIVAPAVEPLYQVHRILFAMLYKMDTAAKGSVSMREFQNACRILLRRFPEDAALCAHPKELISMMGLRGDKEINLQAMLNAFRVQVRDPPSALSGLELLHHMDRDYLRGLIEASNSSGRSSAERHRATTALENVNEHTATNMETESAGQDRISIPYSPLWGHLEKPALPPVAQGRDSSASDVFAFSMLVRGDTDDLPGDDDPLPRGLLKQGSDISAMSDFFDSEG